MSHHLHVECTTTEPGSASAVTDELAATLRTVSGVASVGVHDITKTGTADRTSKILACARVGLNTPVDEMLECSQRAVSGVLAKFPHVRLNRIVLIDGTEADNQEMVTTDPDQFL